MTSDLLYCPMCRKGSSVKGWKSRPVEDEAQCPGCKAWVSRTDLTAYDKEVSPDRGS